MAPSTDLVEFLFYVNTHFLAFRCAILQFSVGM